ncbi:hypothetical protein WMF28_31620 [Sorangium sp. So ce590]|uniref:hypothetical protein n=1 Tax=Sorangium sp. So ce590 TaxID=3133317 RepID=UPI003F5D85D6
MTRFEAVEAISTPYTVEERFATMDASFRVEDGLRSRLCLRVVDTSGKERLFDGIVDRAGWDKQTRSAKSRFSEPFLTRAVRRYELIAERALCDQAGLPRLKRLGLPRRSTKRKASYRIAVPYWH